MDIDIDTATKFRVYLALHNMTPGQFAQIIDYAPHYIYSISRGEVIPGKRLAKTIRQETEGMVDFLVDREKSC